SGPKTLLGHARCQFNFMPGDPEIKTRLVLSCAKANDCESFKTRGLNWDVEGDYDYHVDPDFDLKAWLDDVEGKRSSQSCSIADVVSTVQNRIRDTQGIIDHLKDECLCSNATVYRRIQEAKKKEYIISAGRGIYALGPKANVITERIQ